MLIVGAPNNLHCHCLAYISTWLSFTTKVEQFPSLTRKVFWSQTYQLIKQQKVSHVYKYSQAFQKVSVSKVFKASFKWEEVSILKKIYEHVLYKNYLPFNLHFTTNCAKNFTDIICLKFCASCHNFVLFHLILSAIKSIKNYLSKSCSALAPKMLTKLTPTRNQFHRAFMSVASSNL